jgi:hypothetical protein
MMPSAGLLVSVLLLALAAPPSADALDLKLWPLVRYASSGDGEVVRWSALGPFVEFTRTAETRDLRVRPLLWLRPRRGVRRSDRADVVYPFVASRWDDEYRSFRFLLFTWRTWAPPAPPDPADAPPAWRSRFTLFPFLFYRDDRRGVPRLAVVPFYLDLDDFLGWDNVYGVMLPAYLRLRHGRVERRFYGFPVVSTVGGPDGRGVRVWPFYGTEEVLGRERTRYVLWPFHVRSELLVPGVGWERRRVNFPLWAAIDGPWRTSRAWGMLAYTHTVDHQRGTEVTGAPWPFVLRARRLGEVEHFTWRVAPIYGRSDRDGISSGFWAWPAYRWKTQDVEEFHYEREDVMAILWRRQRLENAASGRRERLLTLFPVLRGAEEDGRAHGQAPALADSLMPKNRGVLALWAPLWGVVRWDTRPDGTRDWNVLWGLLAREGGRWRSPWYVRLGDAPDGR